MIPRDVFMKIYPVLKNTEFCLNFKNFLHIGECRDIFLSILMNLVFQENAISFYNVCKYLSQWRSCQSD